jgi:heptosyltransferase-1
MRVLLIRTSALGDVVHCLPVLTALRRHQPGARIGWVVEDSLAPLLEGHPDLDELLAVRLRHWRSRPLAPRTLREVAGFLERLRLFSADVVLDLMGNHKAGVIGALALSDRLIGPARRDRREPSSACWIGEPVALEGTHVVERALSLLRSLGIPDEPADFGGEKLFPAAAPPPDLPPRFFLVHPGSAWPNKRYPPELWGQAARQLASQSGLPGLVVHGPGEAELARRAAASSGDALAVLATADLATLTAVLRRADLLMGADTGPLHLAHALGTTVLCLLGPTSPETHGPLGGRPGGPAGAARGAAPRDAPTSAAPTSATLFRRLPCSFCHQRFDEPKACLTTLPPRDVAERAARLLGV